MKSTKVLGWVTPGLRTFLLAALWGVLLAAFLGAAAVAVAIARDGNRQSAATQTTSHGGIRQVSSASTSATPAAVTVCTSGCDYGPGSSTATCAGFNVNACPSSFSGHSCTGGLQEALCAVAGGGEVDVLGSLTLNAGVVATGNDESVTFQSGQTVTVAGALANYPSGVFQPFSDLVSNNYSDVYWYGNGVTVNLTVAVSPAFNCNNISSVLGSPPSNWTSESQIDGFEVDEVTGYGLELIGASGYFVPTSDLQTIDDVTLSNITINYASSATGNPSGIYIGGNARNITIDKCVVDQTGSSVSDADALFIRSEWGGSVQGLVVENSSFVSTGTGGRPFELQGSEEQSGVTTDGIKFVNCEFDFGTSEIDIDDDLSQACTDSYLNNVDFDDCVFNGSSPAIDLFAGASSDPNLKFGSVTAGYPLGYVRFHDSTLNGAPLDSCSLDCSSNCSSNCITWENTVPPPMQLRNAVLENSGAAPVLDPTFEPNACLAITSFFSTGTGSYTNGSAYPTGVSCPTPDSFTSGASCPYSVPGACSLGQYELMRQMIEVSGGTGVTITINGVAQSYSSPQNFILNPNDTIAIKATSAPTVDLCALSPALYSASYGGNTVGLTHVLNVSVELLPDASLVSQATNFQTDDPTYQCLNGHSINLWSAPSEFPGLYVVHNGDQGSQCVYGTWTFPVTFLAPTPTMTPTPTATATATATPTATPTPGTLSFSPSSLNFGDKTRVGKVSKPKSVRIKNTSSNKSKLDVTISGETAAAPFAVKSQCKKKLKPGQTCEVKVTFKPPNTTPQTGDLIVNDNGAGKPQMVPLSGTGK